MLALVFVFILVLLVLGVPIAFAIGAPTLIGFQIAGLSLTSFSTSFLTSMDSFTLMAVPFFILSGGLMEKGGISERLVNFAKLFVGKIYGGLGIVTCIACAFFGAVSGSAAATTASMGGIMYPEMKKANYDSNFCAALIAVAGTVGAIIPPSLGFVIYGAATGVSIGDMFAAGVFPGILLTAMLSVTCYITARKNHWVPADMEKKSGRQVLHVLKESILALVMPGIILGGIYSGQFTPTEAGAVACLYALIVAKFIYKSLSWKDIYDIFKDSASLTVVCLIVAAFCDPFAKLLTLGGIPEALEAIITSVASSKITFLIIVNLILIVVGMFVDAVPAIMVLAPLLLPIAQQYDVDPVHFGIIMCMNLTLGLSTPPVGSSLYISASITGMPVADICRKLVPLVGVSILCLLIVTYIPALSVGILGRA